MKCHVLFALLLLPPSIFAGSRDAAIRPVWQIRVPLQKGMQRFPLAAGVLGRTGRNFSVEVHLRPGVLHNPGTILRVLDTAEQPALQLGVSPAGTPEVGRLLEFHITTDFRSEPLSIGLPVKLLDVAAPHDLVLRDLGFRLDLF